MDIYIILLSIIVFILITLLFKFLMNNTPPLNEIIKNSTMDPNMLTKYYKLKLMNDFMNIKYHNPKMSQSQISSQLNMSPSTIQRYRNDINMLSPYRINPNNVKKQQKKTKIDNNGDLKRLQLTSNDLKTTSNVKKKQNQTMFQKLDLYKKKILKIMNTI